ncbi:MAG: hypothetical protein IPK12_23630 [Gemmatimonadetes bacterium]|nr:hypothetical protein [Gemmatimonadota bacterium]
MTCGLRHAPDGDCFPVVLAELSALRARVARLEGALETVAVGMTREDYGALTVTPWVRCIERLRNIARAALAPDAARKEGV